MRLHGLDLIRGFCALAVCVYHISSWAALKLNDNLMGLYSWFGVYGVSLFFILSGYSLTLAYEDRFRNGINKSDLELFIKRRFGRLFPLFASALILSCIGKAIVTKSSLDVDDAIANFILTFGFWQPWKTPVVGGWSIGVEVVFYAIFPILIVCSNLYLVGIFIVSIFMTYWISLELVSYQTLIEAWKTYVTPANHLVLFTIGVCVRRYVKRNVWFAFGMSKLSMVIILVFLFSYGKSELELVTGTNRPIMIALCTLILISALGIESQKIVGFSEFMGKISYPLYLLHPIIFFGLNKILLINGFYSVMCEVCLSVVLS